MRWETTKPWDLAGALGLLLALDALALADVQGPLRVALALPALLLAPGYLLVAALFPEGRRVVEVRAGEAGEDETRRSEEGLGTLERLALSLGLGVALAPLVGLALDATPWGIRLGPLLAALTLLGAACALVAWRRRARLLPGTRFRLRVETAPWSSRSGPDKALAAGLAVALLLAGGALAYALSTPTQDERFTEFYVLDLDGGTDAYPANLTAGGEARVRLGVVNHEGARVVYAARVVAESGRLASEGGNATFVATGATTLSEWTLALEEGARWEEEVAFRLDAPGPHRVRFELDRPGEAAPYRSLRLFVDVTG